MRIQSGFIVSTLTTAVQANPLPEVVSIHIEADRVSYICVGDASGQMIRHTSWTHVARRSAAYVLKDGVGWLEQ